jgi:hypothetical protein
MNHYLKSNIFLVFSLHDARITKMRVERFSQEIKNGILSIDFDNGYFKIDEEKVMQTGKSSVSFSGIDFDFSHVYYFNEDIRKEITFEQLSKDIASNSLEVIDETYGYNLTKFTCNMIKEDSWYEVEIEIYHFNETIYEWED